MRLFFLFLFSTISSCKGQNETMIGESSYYGVGFHGRKTANGEIFDKNEVSAAHKTLPLGCFIRVTNLKNGRTLDIRVNDRGPYSGDRILDVSEKAAEELGFLNEGKTQVSIDILSTPKGKKLEMILYTLMEKSPSFAYQKIPTYTPKKFDYLDSVQNSQGIIEIVHK